MEGGVLVLEGSDGSVARLHAPFAVSDEPASFVPDVSTPPRCAVILVRRGGFAAAIVDGGAVEASDTGKRHVQGRTAAGGWS